MAVRTDFVAGEVLAAQDLNDTFAAKVDYALPVNAQTGTTYTFVLADGLRLTTASNASASTFTIPPQADVVWLANSVIRLVNFGAGVVTFAGGSGVTVTNAAKTLAQFESAACIRTGSDAWTVVPFSGAGEVAANFSNTATGTFSSGGKNFKFITFTTNIDLTITTAGIADVLTVGPGATTSGNGNGGVVAFAQMFLPTGVYRNVIGQSETSQGAGNSSNTRFESSSGAGRGIGAGNLGNGGFSPNANGVVLNMTGTNREYGAAGSRKATLTDAQDRFGIGGDPAISNRAGAGVVIIKVEV